MRRTISRMANLLIGQTFLGRSGASYAVQRLLYKREEDSETGLWVAKNGSVDFTVKAVVPYQWELAWRLKCDLVDSRHVRVPVDGNEELLALVYPYQTEDMLNFVNNKRASAKQNKRVLRRVLEGIRDLHAHRWLHGDIKPGNILLSWHHNEAGEVNVSDVVIADMEQGAQLKKGHSINGVQLGNMYWSSPEALLGNKIKLSTDIWSFGVVVVFALARIALFAYDALEEGFTPSMGILGNQLSYFAHPITKPFVMRFDDEVAHKIADVYEVVNEAGKKPFSGLKIPGLEQRDREFIKRILILDAEARPTAEELLEDPWWDDDVD